MKKSFTFSSIIIIGFVLLLYLFKANYYSLQVNLGKLIWPQKLIQHQISEGKIDQKFQAFFDRDPVRKIPDEKNVIISPADGIIKDISLIDGYYRIVISLSLWDVHIQRVPLDGVILKIEEEGIRDYQNITKTNYLARVYQVVTTMDSEIGPVKVRQLTAVNARRIKVFVGVNDKVRLGDKLGRILLGSTVVIELPKGIILTDAAKVNKRVVGGQSIIAKY